MNLFSIQRRAVIALLFLSGSFASAAGVTLVPQEQEIASDMIHDPDQGRPYMVLDPIIEQVARARAEDMAVRNYFSHVNPDGVAANYLLRQAGYQLPASWDTNPADNYVESIAAGYADASDTWNAWMNSPPHKEHLLAQNSFFATETHYGVGYYYDPSSTYKYYWVVITAPPQPIYIATPAAPAHVTAPDVNVAGTADPGTGAASVQFRIENAAGDSPYVTANGVANWSGTAAGLTPGPNVIRAQSLDSSGNVIAQATRDVDYMIQGTLTVSVSGSGFVTSGFVGVTSQQVGKPITIKASPAPGSIFAGWTGSVVSSGAAVTFTMQDGMNLQANFEPNPFAPVVGPYYGILSTGSGTQNGMVRLSVSSNGLFTGRLFISGSSWPFSGTLDGNGAATIQIPYGNGSSWTVALQADLTGGSEEITGTITNGTDSYGFTASQSTYNAKTNAAAQAGRYTMVLTVDPNTSGTSVPQGNGYAVVVVNANGAATVAGRLADGTPYATTGHLANDGTLALYFAPSGSRGSRVNGLLTFRGTDVSDIDGTLSWVKAPDAKDPFYPAGFATQMPALGSRYTRPVAGLQSLEVSPGPAMVNLGDGNLNAAIDVPVVVSQTDKATMVTPGAPDVTVAINPVSGMVSGSFTLPDGNVRRGVRGVVFQKQKGAFGYFRGINQCGYFSLTPGS